MMESGVVFRDPLWLLALLALPAAWWLQHWRGVTVWLVPFAAAWHREAKMSRFAWMRWTAVAGLALLTLALARPQRRVELRDVRTAGYDLMLVVDLSPSMLAEDYRRGGRPINRLEALRPVLSAFMERRPNDRIGVVIFSGRAYTLAPLTFDHAWVARQLERLRIGLIAEQGTALGDGLALALTRLGQAERHTAGKLDGAFVVLLTDGANNRGLFSPEEAANLARERGVPVYTMAIGTQGEVNMPVYGPDGTKTYVREMSDHDDLMLEWIALRTGGKFFRGVKQRTIAEAFRAIDQAQAIEFRTSRTVMTAELFAWCAAPGVGALLAAAIAQRWWRWKVNVPASARRSPARHELKAAATVDG